MTDMLSRLARGRGKVVPPGAPAWKGKPGKRLELEIVFAKEDKWKSQLNSF